MGDPSSLRFLLDTHIWLWSLLEPEHLTRKVRKALESAENELWLSPISVWETLLLVEKGSVTLNVPADEWLEQAMQNAPMREAPITIEIARLSRIVSLAHQDPADRFLAATAMHLNLTLITADTRLMNSDDFSVLPNK
jgi:PIN domain nuclease of toxin-antitoxin system